MKKIFRRFMMLAALGVVGVSCEKSQIAEDVDTPSGSGAVLHVANLTADTRVDFEDKGTDGLSLEWEEGDTFSLYAEGNKVDDFKCIAVGDEIKFQSVTPSTQLVENTDYSAIYPASSQSTLDDAKKAIDPSEQNGDEINNLDNSLYMLSDFTYLEESIIEFEHQMAIMTFKFKSAKEPKKLIFNNGADSYTVNYSEIQPSGDVYISHIMINPCEATERDLVFSLYDSSDESAKPYEVRKTTSTKAYAAGMRYTASVSDYAEVYFSGGAGSESDPYLISTADDMRELSDRTVIDEGFNVYLFRGKFFKMTADIDLGGKDNEFTAICVSDRAYFAGCFDGAEHTISGLYINKPDTYSQALFSQVEGATIKNLTVSGEVIGGRLVSSIVGICKESTVINCHNRVTVSSSSSSDSNIVGGIVGSNKSSTVFNCTNSATLSNTAKWSFVGGITGKNESNSIVINCYNSAAVIGGDLANVGGISGYNIYESKVINCYSSAAVSCGLGSFYAYANVGGIVGNNSDSSEIVNCHSSAAVSGGAYAKVGGVVGSNYSSTVKDCYWASDATKDGKATDAISGIGEDDISEDATNKTLAEMQEAGFIIALNNGASTYNEQNVVYRACAWIKGTDNYPTLNPSDTKPISTFSGGDGSMATPFLISTADDMRELSDRVAGTNDYITDDFSGKFLKLTADINLNRNEFTAIGNNTNHFAGNFDGTGHTVSGLYINKPEADYQALFGCVQGATIKNLTVDGEVTGRDYVSGIVARIYETSKIENCQNFSNVNSVNYAGGIVGECDINATAKIGCCFNDGNIYSSNCFAGGIAGKIFGQEDYNNKSVVFNSANVGEVSAQRLFVGGVVGANQGGIILNSYNQGAVSGNEAVGGLTGIHELLEGSSSKQAYMYNCYNSAKVSGASNIGGVVGKNDQSTISNSYYDSEICSDLNIVGEGDADASCSTITTAYMQQTIFTKLMNNGAYSYNNDKNPSNRACAWIKGADNYPTLVPMDTNPEFSIFSGGDGSAEDPYIISTSDDMSELSCRVAGTNGYDANKFTGKFFEVTSDIDLGGKDNEFTAIGNNRNYFSGTFDGDGHTISGLYINKPETDYQALFGYINEATVKNIMVSGEVTGKGYVGGIVGYSEQFSTVINCHNNAAVSGKGSYADVGGVVGFNYFYSTVINCYNSEAVSGGDTAFVGGVVGYNNTGSKVINCYNRSAVVCNNPNKIGGVVGINSLSSTVKYGYWVDDVTIDGKYNFPSSGVGSNDNGSTEDIIQKWELDIMQTTSFINQLNKGVSSYNSDNSSSEKAYAWKQGADNFPTLDFGKTPSLND